MVKVYVWLPENPYIGHVALSIQDSYISFWPDSAAGWKDLKKKTSQPGAFMQRLQDDIDNEGGRNPIIVELNDIDELKLREYIKGLQENPPRYQLARNNCSHVVAECLLAATGKHASFKPHAGDYSKLGRVLGRGIWTPSQILKYAQELKLT